MEKFKYFSDCYDLLHDTAVKQTGLEDFGDRNEYLEGMIRLLAAMDDDLGHRLTEMGRQMAFDLIVNKLIARLYTQKGWSEHPEYSNERIERPIFIIGLPRTGTTALHKLLSMDPQFQGVEMWLFSTPMPRPVRSLWPAIPEYNACVDNWNAFKELAPEFGIMHDQVAGEVDECLHGLAQNFCDNYFPCMLHIPSYEAWWWQQQEDAAYLRYADMLKLVGLGDNRQWLLKNPHHLLQLDSLLIAFPDARIIQTHRDPAKAIPSICNLLTTAYKLYLGDNIRPHLTGITEVQKWLQGIHRSQGARKTRKEQFTDVLHKDFLEKPIETVSDLYEKLNLELTDVVAIEMQNWLDNQDSDQKHGHRYEAEDFGLSEGVLHEIFEDYIEEFNLT